MKVIDQINGSALFAQSAFSASVATKDNLGRDITATYLTGISLPESATWNDTSDVVKESSASWNQGKTYEGISPIVVNNDENIVSAETWTFSAGSNVSFVDDNVNKITRIDVTAQGGDAQVNSFVYENSAKINDVNSSYQSNSGTFLTAAPANMATTGDVAELAQTISETYQVKGDYLTTADSANFYPMTGNPSSFATENWVTEQGYITGVDLSEYAKRAFVLSSVELATSGKLDVSSFASVSSDFLTNEDLNGYATESFVENVSGDITALIPTDYYPNTNPSGFISSVDLSNYYQKNETSSKQEISAAIAAIPLGDEEVNQVVHTNSSTWNDVSETVQTNSSVWNDKLDVSSLDLSFGNPVDFGYGITGAYKISGADILANYALADSQGRYITGWYQLKDDNLLSGTKYGTLRIDNENTHLVDTTFSALSSYNGVEISAIPESGVGFYNGGIFPDNTKSTTSHNYDNVLSYSINIQSWDGGFTAQINGTNYDHSYFDGSHTITGEFNNPSTLVVNLYRSNNYMNPQINQFDLGVEGQVNEVVDIRNVFATNEQLDTASSYLSGAIDYVSANAGDEFPVSADEAIQYVQTNSGTIDDTVTSYQTNSGTYLTAHQAISAEEWNSCYDDVNTNSGAWGGTPLPISARDGIDLEIDNGTLYIGASALTGDVANKLDTTAFSDVSATFLTGVDLSNYYTKSETSGADEIANAIASIPMGDPDVNAYVVGNSATIDDVVSTYQGASGTYLTAHQELTGYVPQSAFDELKQSYDALSSLFATYSGQWLLPNEGV